MGGGGEGVGRGLRFGLIPSPDKCSPCFLKFSQFIFLCGVGSPWLGLLGCWSTQDTIELVFNRHYSKTLSFSLLILQVH